MMLEKYKKDYKNTVETMDENLLAYHDKIARLSAGPGSDIYNAIARKYDGKFAGKVVEYYKAKQKELLDIQQKIANATTLNDFKKYSAEAKEIMENLSHDYKIVMDAATAKGSNLDSKLAELTFIRSNRDSYYREMRANAGPKSVVTSQKS